MTVPAIRLAIAEYERTLKPAPAAAAAVLLDRLFACVPMPPPDARPVWKDMLRPFPADVLQRAVDHVIRTHRWPNPPSVADLVQACEQDGEYRNRKAALGRLRAAEQRARWDADMTETLEQRRRMRTAELADGPRAIKPEPRRIEPEKSPEEQQADFERKRAAVLEEMERAGMVPSDMG